MLVDELLKGRASFANVIELVIRKRAKHSWRITFEVMISPLITNLLQDVPLPRRELGFDLFKILGFLDVLTSAMANPLAAINLFNNKINRFAIATFCCEVDALIAFFIRLKPLKADDL